jgi:hypothetical protein
MAGAGNGGSRRKQRQCWGQTIINQRAAAIAVKETAIMAATEMVAVAAAATAAIAEPTAAKAAPAAAKAAADAVAEGTMWTQILYFRDFWWQYK